MSNKEKLVNEINQCETSEALTTWLNSTVEEVRALSDDDFAATRQAWHSRWFAMFDQAPILARMQQLPPVSAEAQQARELRRQILGLCHGKPGVVASSAITQAMVDVFRSAPGLQTMEDLVGGLEVCWDHCGPDRALFDAPTQGTA